MRRLALLAVPVVLSMTACAGSSSTPQAAPTAPTTSSAGSLGGDCSTATPAAPSGGRRLTWAGTAPEGMPEPPGVVVTDSSVGSDGVKVVKAETATSLREAVLFIVHRFPPAGFVLGRGDSEATEADAPFQHGNVHGLVRLLWYGGCQTQWLIATANLGAQQGGSPLLPTHSPSTSASPLPFG